MASWAGFSEEELRRIHETGEQNETAVCATLGLGRKSAPTNRSWQQLQRERALQLAAKQNNGSDTPLSPDQQLKIPPQPSLSCASLSKETDLKSEEPKSSKPETIKHDMNPLPEDSTVKELDRVEVKLREKTRLQQLQWEQRVMEEKNKKRKALLAKTIAEKSKQTQAEAVKLKKIQKELQALDDSVSNDIAILRKLIEQASLEYSVAWKHLEKAEAEYVLAKLDLHKKTEVKERLTEHLSAVIQQNEVRKAHKLDELMLQLEINVVEEVSTVCHTHPAAQGEDKETESPSHSAMENEPALESKEKIHINNMDMNKESSTIVQKTTDDQEGKLCTINANGMS